MSFLTVRTRDGKNERRLAIIKDSFEVIPDFNVNITELNRSSDGTKYKHFFNNGYGGLTFKCQVILKRSKYRDVKGSVEYLHEWFINSIPLIVATDAIDIPHGIDNTLWDAGLFIITKNDKRKQTSENYTVWDLEFTSYTPLNLWRYKNDNTAVLNALKKSTSDKNKGKLKETIALGALQVTFALCPLNQLKYSSKKKSVECVKTLQKLLKKYGLYVNGKIDGWYGKDTMNAVKKYQTKTNLKATGKMNNKTMQYLVNGVTTSKTYVAKKVAKELLNTLGAS